MEIVIVWILSTANLSLVKIALPYAQRDGYEGERWRRQRGERQRQDERTRQLRKGFVCTSVS
jgi:hypothetical protein